MDLQSAVTGVETKCAAVLPLEKGTKVDHLHVVCSGGTCANNEPVPILYLDKGKAIEEWFNTAIAMVSADSTLRWVDKPELVRFQITMADNKRGHRVVSDRYAVRSKFIIEAPHD